MPGSPTGNATAAGRTRPVYLTSRRMSPPAMASVASRGLHRRRDAMLLYDRMTDRAQMCKWKRRASKCIGYGSRFQTVTVMRIHSINLLVDTKERKKQKDKD